MSTADRERRIVRKSYGVAGPHNSVMVPIHGKTQVYKGDLLFLDRVDGLRDKGTSTADNYAYPFNQLSGTTQTLASNIVLAATNFVGIAAWHSDSGITEELFVYIDHDFSFNLKNLKSVRPLYRVIPAGSGTTLFNQKVNIDKSGTTTKYIGLVTHSGDLKASVEFRPITIFQPQYRSLEF